MKTLVAWRLLMHEKGRSVLAILGILVAILLIFLQLGFYTSVPNGGLLVYDALRFDVLLSSREYAFQGRAQTFPRRRVYQARSHGDVAHVAALYQSAGKWLNPEDRLVRKVFVIGFDPSIPVFDIPGINRQRSVVRRPDTVLVDTASRSVFGPQTAGRRVEINGRTMTIGGVYHLGTGFLGLAVAVASDQNFRRLFPRRSLDRVSLGLVTLRPGADANRVAADLRRVLPADTRVFTRSELARHEVAHWVTRSSTGLIFGFGVIVAFIVGLVILFQTLSTQITRNLPEFAMLKAIGYTDRFLGAIVIYQAAMMALIAFGPALGLAIVAYDVTREATLLPIYMTDGRVALVLAVSLAMSCLSAFLSLRAVRRADPVDLF